MKGTSEQYIRNPGRLNEATVTIDTVEYDSRLIHHVTIKYKRHKLNAQWGREDWEVGWFEERLEAEKMALQKLRELNSLIKVAFSMPHRRSPNGVRVRE